MATTPTGDGGGGRTCPPNVPGSDVDPMRQMADGEDVGVEHDDRRRDAAPPIGTILSHVVDVEKRCSMAT